MTLADVPVCIAWDDPKHGPLQVIARGKKAWFVRVVPGPWLSSPDLRRVAISSANGHYVGLFRDHLARALRSEPA
jgi:hypothetical protein